ncbi:RNA polymerase sigma-70 factor (ECF subfamily) [Wenyingzhuangia heitensis]|uniref:RNA polymerase sigma-70 factor (ECF subfamily) n=1 Tax=Wenyingzhuangia heitensis TaxID=1487859 RepID=A0ABX0U9S6_9FLAO|nr:RNA polymerase sigma factor [Wenyingzhuangia heitensis]NIJ45114.1 RNA polymerase sigma-70 factor (ECF subfamily) [Wenyingzhuangia heitensis]
MKNEADFIKKLLNPRQRDRAFVKLLDLYQERLYWHIRKLVVSHENANDVLQNTFIRVYKSLPNFKQQSSLHTWMYRIAYNEAIRLLEKEKNKTHFSVEGLEERHLDNLVSDDYFDGDEAQLKLQRSLLSLSEKHRNIFQMKYYDDLKFREISDILDIKENTIKTIYYSAAKQIEKYMLEVTLLEIKE